MTEPGRWVRLAAAFAQTEQGAPQAGLCLTAAEVLAVEAAGLVVMDAGGSPLDVVCSSNALAAELEELAFVVGEGPSYDAHRDGIPVLEADLGAHGSDRWPAFAQSAFALGASAIFVFPLVLGGASLGALSLYRSQVGNLSDDQFEDALITADIATARILSDQLGEDRNPGEDNVRLYRAEVHQAAGMVSVQLNASVAEALVRLRATAYAEDLKLDDLARQVIARQRLFAS